MRLPPPVLAMLLAAPLLAASLPLSAGAAPLGQASPASGAVRTAEKSASTGRLVLLLDSSGSMKEPAPGGGTKIAAAKAALSDVAENLPDDAEVGVRVFGATVENRSQRGACTDTQNVVPVGQLDRGALTKAVASYKAYGETPIGNALKGAAKDLGAAQEGVRRTIVLLSDGEPTCAPDPCKVAKQLRDRGIDLRINVVGLDVAGKARQALQCIARSGGGRYFDVDSAEDLADSMVQVSVRGLREFSVSGERVTGGTSTADPTSLEPGDYVDTTLAQKASTYYLLDVPDKGGVSASVRMRPGRGNLVDSAYLKLSTPDGVQCANALKQNANVLGLRSIMGASVFYSSATEDDERPCAQAEQMLLEVSFSGPPSEFGLRVRGYPEVSNYFDLIERVGDDAEESWLRPVPLEGSGTPIIGAANFEDAPTLKPGATFSDTLRPREQLIYKVPVQWGQSPRMTARLETDPTAADLQGFLGVQVEARAFNALGAELSAGSDSATGVKPSGRYTGSDPITLAVGQPPVRLRNLEASKPELKQNSYAGNYYFTVQMGGDPDQASERFAAPVRLAVALDGEPEGVPEFVGEVQGVAPTTSPSPEADAGKKAGSAEPDQENSSSDTGLDIPWTVLAVVAGAIVLVLALAGAFLLGRRRSS